LVDVHPAGRISWPRWRQVFAKARISRSPEAQVSSTAMSPALTARWVTELLPPSIRRSASRPAQVQVPAKKCLCSHARTSAEV
jgi:hypothetical protein